MNTIYLLTDIIKEYIRVIAIEAKKNSELASRSETNLFDLFSVLLNKNINQNDILKYLKKSNIKFRFAKSNYIDKLENYEEQERLTLIKRMTLDHSFKSDEIPKILIESIPSSIRFFPKDFTLKETENKFEIKHLTEEEIKIKNEIKFNEKKSLEEIISSNNYYDLSKKHTRRRQSIDISSCLNEIIKTDEVLLGKKFHIPFKQRKEEEIQRHYSFDFNFNVGNDEGNNN
jgi:hypothetical protein